MLKTGNWIDAFGSTWSSVFLDVYITSSVLGRDISSGISTASMVFFNRLQLLVISCNSTVVYWCYLVQARNLPVEKLRPTYYIINALIYLIQVLQNYWQILTPTYWLCILLLISNYANNWFSISLHGRFASGYI